VLASGSGGNCLYVEAGESRVLLDAGLPLRETGGAAARLASTPAI